MRKNFTFLLASACLFLAIPALAQNSALQLSDSNYVSGGPDAVNPNGSFTVEFWVYLPAAGPDGNIHQFVSEGSNGFAFYIGYDGNGKIMVGDVWGSTNASMPFQTWTHIGLTSDANGFSRLYVNGTARDSLDGFLFNDGDAFRVGAQTSDASGQLSQFLTGSIDEVKAWSYDRTAAQIKQDMFTTPDVSDPQLTVYYDMNETADTIVVNSATSTGFTQQGAVNRFQTSSYAWISSPITNTSSNALTFDGVDDQVTIPASSAYDLSSTNGGTVELWVNSATASPTFTTLVGNRGHGAVRYSFHLSSTQVGVDVGNGIVDPLDLPDTFTVTNTWHHLAFANDGSSTSVYINGHFLGSVPGAFGSATGEPLTLGAALTPTNGSNETLFNGSLDEVRIWNFPRPAADIQTTMGYTLTGSESGLVGQFAFDEGAPGANNSGLTTTLDNTAAGNFGLLQNFALTGSASNFNEHTLTSIPLPLTLTRFTASRSGEEVALQWETAQEQNTREFSIERSADGKTYTAIGTVDAAGNSTTTRDYHYTDRNPQPANNYYRLKQSDLDGHFTYSPVRVISFATTGKLIWYLSGHSTAEVYLQKGSTEPYAVTDAAGRLLRLGQLSNGRTEISNLPTGIYFIRVTTNTGPLIVEIAL